METQLFVYLQKEQLLRQQRKLYVMKKLPLFGRKLNSFRPTEKLNKSDVHLGPLVKLVKENYSALLAITIELNFFITYILTL